MTTKLLVIDTQTREVKSFEDRFHCGVAELPDPSEIGDVDIHAELEWFRQAADGQTAAAARKLKEIEETAKALVQLSDEYSKWLDVFTTKAH